MVWSGILEDQLFGPYFFPGTVTANSYTTMLTDYLLPEMRNRGIEPRAVVYMHDGAPAHTARSVADFLTNTFSHHIGGDQRAFIAWPPRSPDLNPLDFYLWGDAKCNVYKTQSSTLDELRQKLIDYFAAVSPETLRKLPDEFHNRILRCIENEGRLIEHLQ